jgi:hypothetical protein
MTVTDESQSGEQTVVWRHPATDALSRTRALVSRALPSPLVRLGRRWLRFWYALQREGRSFRGHIQTLLAKKHWGIDLGPEFQRSPSGHLVENEWTEARSLGMQALNSRYPWASTVDLQIFLEGVHVGEQSALRILGFGSDKQVLGGVAVEPSHILASAGNSKPLPDAQQSSRPDPRGASRPPKSA